MADDKTAMFNDAFGYLATIGWLIDAAHKQSMDDEDVHDWFYVLEQLHIEIDGQLSDKKAKVKEELREGLAINDPLKYFGERDYLENLRKEVSEKMHMFDFNKKTLSQKREVVRPYHVWINRLIHKHNLRMKYAPNHVSMFGASQTEE